MAFIQMTAEAKDKLLQLLAEEGQGACVRLRMYKLGSG